MSSTQFGGNSAASPPWNVPPGGPGQYLSPNSQMWNQPTPQQWNNPTVTPVMTQSTVFHQEFMKGKPKGLGITLIILSIFQVGMGIGLILTASYTATFSGIPFWGAIFNIVAGSLTVKAVYKPSLIKGALGVNIVVSIVSVCGLILNIVDFFVQYYCYDYYNIDCNGLIIGGHIIRGLFIITYLLQFSISVSISVFACRAQEHYNPTVPTQVIMVQDPATFMQPSTVPGSYPPYSSPQPYMMQSGMSGGPKA